MPKKFYTEKDIEELFNKGAKSLTLGDDVALTELAYEKANRLGMQLTTDTPPSAPVRPYLSEKGTRQKTETGIGVEEKRIESDLHNRIKNAVVAKMGEQIPSDLLDSIIRRVLKSTGVK